CAACSGKSKRAPRLRRRKHRVPARRRSAKRRVHVLREDKRKRDHGHTEERPPHGLRGELTEHEAALRQALWVLEERAIVERRAVTARRVLEPAANELGTFDRLAKQRQLLLGDLAQLFG